MESKIHPSMVWHVDHDQSPARCLVCGIVCGGHGGGRAVSPAPVLGSHQKIRPRTPGDLLWGATGMGRGSI